jgi:hypothetical protein
MTSCLIISMALTKVLGLERLKVSIERLKVSLRKVLGFERLKVSIERLNVFYGKVLGLERLIVSLSSDEMRPCDKQDENTKLSRLVQNGDVVAHDCVPSSADRTMRKLTRARFISRRA